MFINSSSELRYANFTVVEYSMSMVVIYSCMGIIGVVGNVVTCIVIINNKSMHTATNCYLFNLAVSDLLILFWGVPIYNSMSYCSEFVCKFRVLSAKSSLNVAIFIICVLSIERYVAICHPFLDSKHHQSSLSRAMKTVPVIWLIGFLGALPFSLQYGLVYQAQNPTVNNCRKINKIITYFEGIRSLFIFAIPMLIISTMYVLIGLKLRESSGQITSHNEPADRNKQRAPKMLLVVVGAFFIFQMPIHMIRMFRIYNNAFKPLSEIIDKTTWVYVTDVSHVMYYLSSLINPILYNIMSRKFRAAFKVTILKCFKTSSWSVYSTSDVISRNSNHERKVDVTVKENQL